MQPIVAHADEEVRRVMRAVSADVQASLALSRATLRTLAALSPAVHAAAQQALEQELVTAQRRAAPQLVIDLIEDVRLHLAEAPQEERLASALEQALAAAADALPDAEAATQQLG